jgi:hypothetical protein
MVSVLNVSRFACNSWADGSWAPDSVFWIDAVMLIMLKSSPTQMIGVAEGLAQKFAYYV